MEVHLQKISRDKCTMKGSSNASAPETPPLPHLHWIPTDGNRYNHFPPMISMDYFTHSPMRSALSSREDRTSRLSQLLKKYGEPLREKYCNPRRKNQSYSYTAMHTSATLSSVRTILYCSWTRMDSWKEEMRRTISVSCYYLSAGMTR